MRIQAAGGSNSNFHPVHLNAAERGAAVRNAAPASAEPAVTRTSLPFAAPDIGGEATSGDARGVVRLLESGHFNGVADVRLRINFFEELSARAESASSSVVSAESQALIDRVNEGLDDFVAALDIPLDQQDAFADAAASFASAVNETVGQFASGGGFDVDGLADSVQAAFDALFEQVYDAASAGAAADADVAPIVEGAENPAESDDPVDAGLTALSEAFAEALAGFLDAASAAMLLPDPASSSGHGAAYDKFVAIYNDLRGVAVEEVG